MSVFASIYANQYDAMYADKDYNAECDLVAAAAAEHAVPINRLLDIGCGTGGHSLEWARRAIASVGVDMSPAMIELARTKAGQLDTPIKPIWQVGDARTFEAEGSFDVATMMFAVLGYMTSNDDVIAALKNVRRHLRTGGVFVFDVWYGPAVLSVRPEGRVRLLRGQDGSETIRAASTEIDSFRHLAHVAFRLWTVREDRFLGSAEETHAMRYFFPQELDLLLTSTGFDMASLRSFPDNGRVSDESWNAICVAKAV
jgi:SAM-dependent methyltransferase